MKARITGRAVDFNTTLVPAQGLTPDAMRERMEYTADMPEPKKTVLRTFRVNADEERLRGVSLKFPGAIFVNFENIAYQNGFRIDYSAYLRR